MEDTVKNLMERYNNPTNRDFAPYGTVWKVIVDQPNSYFYIQVSENEKEPEWILMEKFLEKVMEPLYTDEQFIDYCINIYKGKKIIKKDKVTILPYDKSEK